MKPMRQVAELLQEMTSAGVITNYAVFGAVAQMKYTEAIPTQDVDILVALPGGSSLDALRSVHDYCSSRGFVSEGEAIRVGDWPVQFYPVFSQLTEEALRDAEVTDMEGVPIRVVRPDHLALISLEAGRPKDSLRIIFLVESGAVSVEGLRQPAERHGLAAKLEQFNARFYG